MKGRWSAVAFALDLDGAVWEADFNSALYLSANVVEGAGWHLDRYEWEGDESFFDLISDQHLTRRWMIRNCM